MDAKTIFNEEELSKLLQLYNDGYSISAISRLYGWFDRAISRTLKGLGIPTKRIYRQYKIDEEFFSVIDTEAKAYFLGLMFADGNVSKDGKSFSIGLNQEDQYIVEAFSRCIYGIEHLTIRKGRKHTELDCLKYGFKSEYSSAQCVMFVSSIKLNKALQDLGCVPCKSLILKFPSKVPYDLMHHFIRGFLDGDGCITFDGPACSVIFTSSNDFCIGLSQYLQQVLTDVKAIVHLRKRNGMATNTYACGIRGNRQAKKLLDYLYKDATLFLTRKHDKYLELTKKLEEIDLQWGTRYSNPTSIKKLDQREIDNMVKLKMDGVSCRKMGPWYGLTGKSIAVILRNLPKYLNAA